MVSAGGAIVVDPTYEEMLISNNLLTITCLPNGSHHLDKSLSLRTYASQNHNMQPIELKPHTLSLLQLAEGIDTGKKVCLRAIKEWRAASSQKDEYVINN